VDFVPWRLCNTILADRVYNAAPGQVVLQWFHQARGTGGVEERRRQPRLLRISGMKD